MSSLVLSLLLFVAWPSVSVLAAEDHEAAPMMAPADAPMTEDEFAQGNEPTGRQAPAGQILDRFRQRFGGDGPRVAVFWNRRLPARVSDWSSTRRVVLGASLELSGTHQGKAEDLAGKASTSAQAETRDGERYRRGRDMAFALQSGLIAAFREGGATVVDRALARRITDDGLEDGTFSRLSPDRARLEMRALAEHADYVLELVAAEDFAATPRYRIRVLAVDDASTLVSLVSPGRPPDDGDDGEWVASADGGYDKRERPISMARVGRELALHTMEAMAGR